MRYKRDRITCVITGRFLLLVRMERLERLLIVGLWWLSIELKNADDNLGDGSDKRTYNRRCFRLYPLSFHIHSLLEVDEAVINKSALIAEGYVVIDISERNISHRILDVPEAVFGKISQFLKSKVMLKRKDLKPEQQKEKADQLALAFFKSNAVSSLDRKTMKLLSEYAEKCIY
ncbi:hypothetical protein NPIL_260921 [Nephila pilipes]|uniref:Uncharacterized protein n=1 Tax=Nephila pilipes TaxID=299642 RepID=A0A8X6QDM2_NEPPI|nr:hypothetical protein NPIL_260921 [Nephila pilipes]